MSPGDWLSLFAHFVSLSLLAVGGVVATTPDMHRYLVDQHHWLTDAQFGSSIALGQAAPGPNVLFVALIGWNIGLNAGGYGTAFLGLLLTMTGILLPSATLALLAARWAQRNRERRAVQAFKAGMAPLVIALLIATSWVLIRTQAHSWQHWPIWLLGLTSAVLTWRTRIHVLWLMGAGATAGVLGWV